jgi:hypothetical protein
MMMMTKHFVFTAMENMDLHKRTRKVSLPGEIEVRHCKPYKKKHFVYR